jgi:hypothetical protein
MRYGFAWVVLALGGVACSEELGARFTVDPRPEGAAMWLEGEVESDGGLTVGVWAAGIGPVFGYSAHLTFDDKVLRLADDGAFASEAVLGPDARNAAVYVWSAEPGDLAFGATRRGPTLGEVELGAAVCLGKVELTPRGEGRTRIDLSRVIIRRDDESFVATHTAGGRVTVGG